MSKPDEKKIDEWIRQLSDENMPGFSGTVTDVTGAVNSSDTSAGDVAQAILKDPSLTSRLLKMANSLYYNPNKQEISTVTRAVMVMGFDQVRAVALSLVLVDSFEDCHQRGKLTEEVAQSFHAAIQAQEFARRTNCTSPESVFVAALLSRLGNMAFWAFSDDKAAELLKLLETSDMSESDVESTVLGFSLHDLTRALSKAWSLSGLLDESLVSKEVDKPQLANVNAGKILANAAKAGWDSLKAQRAIEIVADRLNLNQDEVEELAYLHAKQAKEVTKLYGVTAASKCIPQVSVVPTILDDEEQDVGEHKVDSAETETSSGNEGKIVIKNDVKQDISAAEKIYHEPDNNLQLTILSDITQAISEKPNISIILEMVLEGLYRGVGMDRSFFAILSKDRKNIKCKYALGTGSAELCSEFTVDISQPKNIFNQVIKSKTGRHIPADPKKLGGTLSREVLKLLGPPPYLIMPAVVRDKVIGIYLADRNSSKRTIEEADFIAFQRFCQQANMGLTFLSMQG